ncbi:transcription termination/antitermination protein NusG [Oceaniradius stylonematis]|uniref:transcription termination/antitermination protein NusG n=1 Tax=Oceaniradius stylonematis TaxID=2184161 RepID=UPI003B5A90AE
MTVQPDQTRGDWLDHVSDRDRSLAKDDAERRRREMIAWLRAAAADRTPDGVAGPARWFLIRVHAARSASITRQMNRAGIRCWCPRLKIHKRLPRQQQRLTHTEIAFPGYLLVKVVPHAMSFEALRTFDGFIGVLGNPQGCVPLTDKQFKLLWKALRPVKASRRAPTLYKAGEAVQIIIGSFAGFPAKVARPDDVRNQIKVEVDIFGRQTLVEMGVDDIRPAG